MFCTILKKAGYLLPFLLIFAFNARAEETFIKSLELQAGTEAPVSFGSRGIINFGYGFHVGAGIGYMPRLYVNAINSLLVALNTYDDTTADLIENSLTNSLVVDLAVGWDPGKRGGFYFDLGYSYITLGGEVSPLTVLEETTGYDLSFARSQTTTDTSHPIADKIAEATSQRQEEPSIPVATSIHNATFHIGYKFLLGKHWEIVTALGVIKTFASSTSVDFNLSGPQIEESKKEIDNYMNDIYVKYVVSPTLSIMLGYSF